MPRTTEQNEALRSATRSAVETAAVRVFAHRGFAAASIRQIADEAGLSIGSIYRHYDSKEQLFDALLDQATTGLAAAAAEFSSEGDPIEMIRSFTEAYVADLAADDGAVEFSVLMNQAFTTDTPEGATARLAETQNALWRSFAALVERGQAAKQIASGDPERMTAHYFAMLTGLTMMRAALGARTPPADVDLILRLMEGGDR